MVRFMQLALKGIFYILENQKGTINLSLRNKRVLTFPVYQGFSTGGPRAKIAAWSPCKWHAAQQAKIINWLLKFI